jgi:nucleotide sugar dehydrogenase
MSFAFLNIVGYGYVGGGLGHLCKSNNVQFCTYDVVEKDELKAIMNTSNLEKLVRHSELYNEDNVYTICVPTPSSKEGECDISIVESVIKKLYETVESKSNIVIIKSTVQPGTTRMLMKKFKDKLEIVFCPEFLKEHTYKEDMYNADFCLVGSDNENTKVKDVMRTLYKHKEIDVICRSPEECELFKYTVNVFLAVKVWYFNEISEICNKFGVEYQSLQSLFKLEKRIGESHTDVPGHDSLYGFGGKCLPKETLALKYLQNKLGIPNQVLENILNRNDKLRYNKD